MTDATSETESKKSDGLNLSALWQRFRTIILFAIGNITLIGTIFGFYFNWANKQIDLRVAQYVEPLMDLVSGTALAGEVPRNETIQMLETVCERFRHDPRRHVQYKIAVDGLAEAISFCGSPTSAERVFRKLEDEYLKDVGLSAATCYALCNYCFRTGRIDEARRYLATGSIMATENGATDEENQFDWVATKMAVATGNLDEAVKHAFRAYSNNVEYSPNFFYGYIECVNRGSDGERFESMYPGFADRGTEFVRLFQREIERVPDRPMNDLVVARRPVIWDMPGTIWGELLPFVDFGVMNLRIANETKSLVKVNAIEFVSSEVNWTRVFNEPIDCLASAQTSAVITYVDLPTDKSPIIVDVSSRESLLSGHFDSTNPDFHPIFCSPNDPVLVGDKFAEALKLDGFVRFEFESSDGKTAYEAPCVVMFFRVAHGD